MNILNCYMVIIILLILIKKFKKEYRGFNSHCKDIFKNHLTTVRFLLVMKDVNDKPDVLRMTHVFFGA